VVKDGSAVAHPRQAALALPIVDGVMTTGTLTDVWPVAAGETWSSDYGAFSVTGVMLTLG